MERTATIIDFNIIPMVELVPSQLHVIYELDNNHRLTIVDNDSVENLSSRYGFRISREGGEKTYDFTGFRGRRCVVWFPEGDPGSARFIKFID